MKKFKKKVKYKSLCIIFSPSGIIPEGTILTGLEWINVLGYDVGNSFEQMFEITA